MSGLGIASNRRDISKRSNGNTMFTISLLVIFLIVLAGPFLNKKIESNLEAFLFIDGGRQRDCIERLECRRDPRRFPCADQYHARGARCRYLFHYLRKYIDHAMRRVLITVPLGVIVCTGIIVLGLVSSIISAIIAALLLVEFITVLPLHRHAEINLTIIACFAIGLGAALTPLGEPLSTIVVSKLGGAPYHADFFYLAKLLGFYLVPAVILFGIASIFWFRKAPEDTEQTLRAEEDEDKLSEVFIVPPKFISLSWR